MPKPLVTSEMKLEASQKLTSRFSLLGCKLTDITMLRVGGGSRPHVARVCIDGRYGIIKDHDGCDPLFSRFLGKLLAKREVHALRRLEHLEGVPKVIQVFDSHAFLMSDLRAVPFRVSQLEKDEWELFFSKLASLIMQFHCAGVAHCDLRSLDNTLVDNLGNPAIVDFVASFKQGRVWNLPARWAFKKFCQVDYSAINKQKHVVAPWLLSQSDIVERKQESLFSRLIRNTGIQIRKIARLLFTRKI